MHTCLQCGRTMKGVVCINCRDARARQGLLRHQRRFVRTWLEGTIELRFAVKDNVTHLVLFDDQWHAYCYTDLFKVEPADRRRDKAIPENLCGDCRAIFDHIATEQKALLLPAIPRAIPAEPPSI